MRVLLTTSAAPEQSPISTSEKRAPLGVGSLISVLRNAGHEVFFIDNFLKPSDFLETGFVHQNKIECVGIYTNSVCFNHSLQMFHKLEKMRKSGEWNGLILAGGPHATISPESIPSFVDFVVRGEGEHALLDILSGKASQRILAYPRIKNLDELPRPAYDIFAKMPYDWSAPFFDAKPVFTMNSSRGCPFNCLFCSAKNIWNRKYTCHSAQRVVEDFEHLVSAYGAKGIYFREDNFTCNKPRLTRFCNLMIEHANKTPWACETRVSSLDKNTVELMAKAGLRGVYLGVESGSQRVLDLMNKGTRVQQIEDAIRLCKEFGIKVAASFIHGMPGETEQDEFLTEELIRDLNPDQVWHNVCMGHPASDLYSNLLKTRNFEYIDKSGIVHIKGHDALVRKHYSKNYFARRAIPRWRGTENSTEPSPTVSVLMCVHNDENYIAEALKSIYDQSFQDFEFIIVDDASSDNSTDILCKSRDNRTIIYRNSQNLGLTKSLNIGLALCRGEFIARMDANDYADPTRFEKQVAYLRSRPDCVAVGVWCHRIDEKNQICGKWDPPIDSAEIRAKLQKSSTLAHTSVMIRRDALISVGGYNDLIKYAQDYDLWLRLSEVGNLNNIPERLQHIRMLPNSISSGLKTKQDEFAQLARKLSCVRSDYKRYLPLPSSVNLDKCSISNSTAAEYFQRSQIEFTRGNFLSAVEYCGIYKCLIDYDSLPRFVEKKPATEYDVSVVVVTYKRSEDVRRAMEALKNQDAQGLSYEVIIVDNGQSDPAELHGLFDQYVCCPINFNLSEGRNIGVHFASGKIVVFLDDDALVAPDYIRNIKEAFDTYEIAGLRGRAYPKSHQQANDHISIYNLGEKPFPTYCNQEGNSAFLREVYLAVGGMDPLLFGHEGSDLTWRIIKAYGQTNRIMYWPKAIIWHDFGTGEKFGYKKKIHQRSAMYLKYKHNADIFANRHDIESGQLVLRAEKSLNWPFAVKPVVSIVIACYNSEKFLPECLDSIRGQTFTDWELLLVDDCSTESTREVISRYAKIDNRIRPFYFDDNAGPYVRRNYAIENARSPFILIQDADDIMAQNKLKVFYREITSNEQLGIVGSFYRLFLDKFDGLDATEPCTLEINNDEILRDFQRSRYITWHGSAIIRKSVFDTIGLYDKHPYGSDKLWLAKAGEYAALTGKITLKNIPEFLTYKREHPLSQQGLLPPLDPKSRRARFQTYWDEKLSDVRNRYQQNPEMDVAAELKAIDCSDYIERFGHLFEQWESQPLQKCDLYKFMARALNQLVTGRYVNCIITLDSLVRMVDGVAKEYRDFNFLRALAYFAIGRDDSCRKYLQAEIADHASQKAYDFIASYLESKKAFTIGERQKAVNTVLCAPDGTLKPEYDLDKQFPDLAVGRARDAYDAKPDAIRTAYILGSLYIKMSKWAHATELLEKTLALTIPVFHAQDLLDPEETIESHKELFISTCTKLAQCYMQSKSYSKIKTVYGLLLEGKYAQLPADQQPGIERIYGMLSGIGLEPLNLNGAQPPSVSIIMPAFNVEKYIGQAIESVLAQDYRDFELIIVNDGSTDNTFGVIRAFADLRIRCINQSNAGLSGARNTAINSARGGIIIILDSDDMMAPGFIEKHLQIFRSNPDADMIYCDDQLVNADGSFLRRMSWPSYTDYRRLAHDLFCCAFPVIPFRTAIKKTVFEKIGLYDSSLRGNEDYDMIRKFARAGLKAVHLPEPLYIRRMHPESLTHRPNPHSSAVHFRLINSFVETFTCEELFPDVNWQIIPPQSRPMMANCLIGAVFRAIAKNYTQTGSGVNAVMAFDHACAYLKKSLEIEPGNQQATILLDQINVEIQSLTAQPNLASQVSPVTLDNKAG